MGNVVYLNELESVKDRFTLAGKKAFVTGAAGGIGRSTAAAIAELGADIALVDMKLDVAQDNARYIADRYGVKTIAVAADVSDPASVDAMMATILQEFGRIDAVHSNAGVITPDDSGEMSVESWKHMIDVNLTGMFLVNKAVAVAMKSQGLGGAVVNTASMSGHIINYAPEPARSGVAYCATKAGVMHLTKGMAMDFRKDGIRFNSISPGYMYSGIHDAIPQETLDAVAAEEPLGRFGSMNEIGGIVAFLLTDLASYITGADILVDGGHTVW
jgi:NAD(P)-dependent dehydrogenase (short-subunit alcohol dehydrogenase family)